jgi:GR25 family glycosyltransferase involved in LPS biosynthesis
MKTLNDYFDRIYCLNLAHRTDKWDAMCEEFRKHNLVVQRIEGVWGIKVWRPELHDNAGAYGCLMSNRLALQDAYEKGYEKILILEDDVYFEENMNQKFWDKIEHLPVDWNILHLGGNNGFDVAPFEMITGDKSFKITKENYQTLNNEIVKTKWTQCAPAIGYNKNIIADLLKRLETWRLAYDSLIPILEKENIYNGYIFLPTLAKPKAGINDFDGYYVDYLSDSKNNF